jgi:hypothetical protein
LRNTLVAALVACADRPKKLAACRFLLGLSSDELQFIAEYLGACILECQMRCATGGVRFTQHASPDVSADRELKMILLREYICRAGVKGLPASAPRYAMN